MSAARFAGTVNPRHLRTIQALMTRPVTREHLDQIAGCSNGPELVAELRRRGLDVPCVRTRKKDRDLFDCWPGVYHFTKQDRRRVLAWISTRGGYSHGVYNYRDNLEQGCKPLAITQWSDEVYNWRHQQSRERTPDYLGNWSMPPICPAPVKGGK